MCDKFRTLLVIYLSFMFVFSDSYEQRDGNKKLLSEGSACLQLGLPGICRRVKECPIALDALKNKGYHELKRCGFEGSQEIVCCPDLAERGPSIETSTLDGVIWPNPEISTKPSSGGNVDNQGRVKIKRKCEKMCDKIYADNNIKPDIDFHILNGQDAGQGQFPHAVALGFLNANDEIVWNCGAALISSRFLLTAAHCFYTISFGDPVRARLGTVDINDVESAQDIDVKKATGHPEYDHTSKHNDVGIVELVRDVQMSKILYPACLYTESDDPMGLQIIGWGQTVANDVNSQSRILQFAAVEPVSVTQCNITVTTKNKFSLKVILNTQICATTSKDACQGDSGGPLQIKKKEGGYAIVGIVSYGAGCGTPIPGIYTRVSRYLDWIEQMVWPD